MLLIVVAISGALYGDDAAAGRIVAEIADYVGRDNAETIEALLRTSAPVGDSLLASVAGTLVLILGATRAFASMKQAVDTLWVLPPRRESPAWLQFVLTRLLSFALVLAVGGILMLLLVVSAALALLDEAVAMWLHDDLLNYLLVGGETMAFMLAATLLFALVYKVLPEAHILWSDVWLGAFTTAVLLAAGKSALSWYLARGAVATTFGAAGSIVVVLVWVYYSAQIVLFGAEVTQAYASTLGSHRPPEPPPEPAP